MSQASEPIGCAGEWLPPRLPAGEPPAGGAAGGGAASGGAVQPERCASGAFPGPAEALAAAEAGLAYLARADVAGLPSETLAGCLRGYARAEAVLAAGRSRLLSAFNTADGQAADGHPTVRSWLRWQTRSTGAAAGAAVWWMRRLAAHPRIAGALAAAAVSLSWARLLVEWSDKLPPDARDAADKILLEAAASGAELPELSRIAEQLYAATAPPEPEPEPEPGPGTGSADDDGFADRRVWLDVHWKGAGRLAGDLTPQCAAALGAALESLGKKAGPEDDRTHSQRRHDALEELARMALGSGDLPDVAGQPAQVLLHVTLDQLAAMPGAAEAAAAWAASGAGPGWLRSAAAAQGYACDAKIMPVVTGHPDPAVLARLAAQVRAMNQPGQPGHVPAGGPGPSSGSRLTPASRLAGNAPAPAVLAGNPATDPNPPSPGPAGLGEGPPGAPVGNNQPGDSLAAGTLLAWAVDLLSGPAGLAAALRAGTAGPPAAGISLPLDVGAATAAIPPHLRRAVTTRDRHCAWPGCNRPPAHCQVHHVKPRAQGGPTAPHNLVLPCSYHHLTAIHRNDWTLTLHPDATTTAVSPDRTRTYHTHNPPPAQAA